MWVSFSSLIFSMSVSVYVATPLLLPQIFSLPFQCLHVSDLWCRNTFECVSYCFPTSVRLSAAQRSTLIILSLFLWYFEICFNHRRFWLCCVIIWCIKLHWHLIYLTWVVVPVLCGVIHEIEFFFCFLLTFIYCMVILLLQSVDKCITFLRLVCVCLFVRGHKRWRVDEWEVWMCVLSFV